MTFRDSAQELDAMQTVTQDQWPRGTQARSCEQLFTIRLLKSPTLLQVFINISVIIHDTLYWRRR